MNRFWNIIIYSLAVALPVFVYSSIYRLAAFTALSVLIALALVYYVKPRHPEWWREYIVDYNPVEPAALETVCRLLDLNAAAGLGWQLTQVDIKQDKNIPTLFYLYAESAWDDVQASMLARRLSALAAIRPLKSIQFQVIARA